jgi:endonuclease G
MSTGSKAEDTLYVCKGGTIDIVNSEGGVKDPILTTLSNGLIVPKYFFMALLRKSKTGYKGLAFWAEHLKEDRSNDPLSNYVINIRELERRTGIDFFCNLPDAIEEDVENTTVENIKWLWNL